MTRLSDACSAGTFEVTSNPTEMTVHDTAKIGINLRSRLGSPLLGRTFQGGTNVAYVSGWDSTLFATNISDEPSTVPIVLYNSHKIRTSLTVNRVVKRPMLPTVTYTPYQGSSGERYWIYTATVKRADGGPVTWASAKPLDPQEGNFGSWLGSNTLAKEISTSYLDQWGEFPPSTRWEVRTYDGLYHIPMYNLIGIDTVNATLGNTPISAVNTASMFLGPAVGGMMSDASLPPVHPSSTQTDPKGGRTVVASERVGLPIQSLMSGRSQRSANSRSVAKEKR
jgi:hypothetical protein